MIRLLIAGDEDLLRGALLALEPVLTVVAEAARSAEAVRLVWEHRMDWFVVGASLPVGVR